MKINWKKIAFLSSLFFLIGLVCFSFIYTYVLKEHIKEPPTFIYDKEGKLTKTFPFPPSLQYPFGVDRHGNNLFWWVIEGAKYTILISIGASILRVGLGVSIGILYGMYLQKLKIVFTTIERAFRFVPAIFLGIMFLNFNFFGQATKGFTYLLSVVILLSVLALPSLVNGIGNEVIHFNKETFITSSKGMGASKFWIIRKHVIPFLRTRMLLMIIQQMISILFLLVHLGVFGIFVGGSTTIDFFGRLMKRPVSYEWSSLISVSYKELMMDQWIVFGPSLAFILTILACHIMKRTLEDNGEKYVKTKTEQNNLTEVKDIKNADFKFAEHPLSSRVIDN